MKGESKITNEELARMVAKGFSSVENRMATKEGLLALGSKVDGLGSRFDNLEKKVDNIDKNVKEINMKIYDIEETVSRHSRRIEKLEEVALEK